jgi:hypothetical protein
MTDAQRYALIALGTAAAIATLVAAGVLNGDTLSLSDGGTVTVVNPFVTPPPSSPIDTSCLPRVYQCPIATPTGYAEVLLPFYACDGGNNGATQVTQVPGLDAGAVIDPHRCRLISVGGLCASSQLCQSALNLIDAGMWAPWQSATPSCFCADNTGTCLRSDGGVVPMGTTIEPAVHGAVSGAGCVPKVCHEWSGVPGFPTACVAP